MAPEFYDERELLSGNSGNPYDAIKKAFTSPEFYACMGVGRPLIGEEEEMEKGKGQ